MKIGIQELLLVFIVALIVLGPDKLPLYARKFGEALREFRKFSSDATKDIRESIVEPLEEAQRPLREALEPITELEKEVRGERGRDPKVPLRYQQARQKDAGDGIRERKC